MLSQLNILWTVIAKQNIITTTLKTDVQVLRVLEHWGPLKCPSLFPSRVKKQLRGTIAWTKQTNVKKKLTQKCKYLILRIKWNEKVLQLPASYAINQCCCTIHLGNHSIFVIHLSQSISRCYIVKYWTSITIGNYTYTTRSFPRKNIKQVRAQL